jgi:hypothetical protein
MPRDAEQPAAERGRFALELIEVPGHLEPGLRGGVLGRGAGHHTQVAQDRGLQRAPENAESALVAGPRGGQRGGDVVIRRQVRAP